MRAHAEPTRRNSRRQEIRTFATTTNALLQLRDWLVEQQVTLVVLEATGDYWRGVYYLLEDTLNVLLVNAAHAKGLPGRKTDVSDSAWLAQLGECGLLKASFVPPEPVRHLRDLTRYRSTLAVERTREAQRLEKELEDAGIKISAVATDILGASGRAMLAALIAGQDDAQVMAEMAKGRMRPNIPALVQALTGHFGEHHWFLCRLHRTRIDELSATIEELSTRIEAEMRPFTHQIEHLVTIPGVQKATAEVIIAETGADMTRFHTPANLASWAGVCPGHHESAGIHRSSKRRHGNRWLGGALGTAAEPSVAVSAFTGTVDAGGLVVAWADPGPRREVGWGVEPGHVGAGLGDDDLGGGLLDPGDGHQVFNLVGERGASPPRSASRAPRWWRTARRYGSGADGTRTRDAHQSGPSGLGPGPGSWVASGLWPSRP